MELSVQKELLEAVFGGQFSDNAELTPDIEHEILIALENLEPRYELVIRQRFEDKRTLASIAKTLPRKLSGIGVTTERVRQMEARALRMLRHPARLGRIRLAIRELQGYETF